MVKDDYRNNTKCGGKSLGGNEMEQDIRGDVLF